MNSPLNHRTPFFERGPRFFLGGAGVLALYFVIVAVLVPLFFLSGREIEADKARFIELAAIPVIWPALRAWRQVPELLGWVTALLLTSWLLATVYAVGPVTAILGGPYRGRGLLFFLACLVWLGAAAECRRRLAGGGVETAYWCLALSGTGPAIVAVFQLLGRFPLNSHGIVGSTLGNASFLRDYLAVCGALAAFLLLRRRWAWTLAALGLPAFGAWTLTPARRPALDYRLHLWATLGTPIGEAWLFGYGPESGQIVVDAYGHQAANDGDVMAQDRTENLLLDSAIERGVPGALCEAEFWLAVLWLGRRSRALGPLVVGLALANVSVVSVASVFLLFILAGWAITPRERIPSRLPKLQVPVDELRDAAI